MFRRPKTSYTVVSNTLANSSLPLDCVGMLVYLLSKPEGWEGHNYDIERRGKFGPKKRRALIKKAEEAGWLKFCVEHVDGRLNCWYEVQGEPLEPDQRTDSSKHGTSNTTPPAEGGLYNPPQKNGVVSNRVVEGGAILSVIKESTNKEVVAATAEAWTAFQKEAKLDDFELKMIQDSAPHASASLLKAALACWFEPRGSKKRWSDNSPIAFLRGVLSDPRAFGVRVIDDEFIYHAKTTNEDGKRAALLAAAKRQIVEQRAMGRTDRDINVYLSIPFKADVINEAFKELNHVHQD
jgi:hypothetical protein